MNTLYYFEFMDALYSGAFASARVAPVFFLLPFLSTGYLSGAVRMPVIIIVAMSLWPHHSIDMSLVKEENPLLIIIHEVGVGTVLGVLLALPFWIFQAIGAICDNQRGSMMSSIFDPMTGGDTPELGKLFNLFACVIYLQNGGLLYFLDTIRNSYEFCSPSGIYKIDISYLYGYLNYLVKQSILISSPVIGVLLCTEIFLGLLSRFAPQMNAFSVLLTVKSFATIFVLLLYFSSVSSELVMIFSSYSRFFPFSTTFG